MKRLVFCIIALSMVFVFTACGGTRDGAEGGSSDTSAVLDASADISGEATDPETEPTETAGESSATATGTDSESSTADSVSSAPTEDTVPVTDAPVTRPSVTTPSHVTSPITAPPTINSPVTAPPVTEPPHVTEPCRHVNTEVRNRLEATTSAAGYTGDTYCRDCGALVSYGESIPKIKQTYTAVHDYYDIEMEIFRLINEERVKNGVAPLIWDEELYPGTKVRVIETNEVWGHTRPNGQRSVTAIYENTNYDESSFCSYGENLASSLGYADTEEIAKNFVKNGWTHPGTGITFYIRISLMPQ